jgi:hypothetical protein
MQNQKKMYQAPKIYAHGSVTELTMKGGGDSIDVPYGTPVTTPISIDSITGYVSKP